MSGLDTPRFSPEQQRHVEQLINRRMSRASRSQKKLEDTLAKAEDDLAKTRAELTYWKQLGLHQNTRLAALETLMASQPPKTSNTHTAQEERS